MTCQIGLSHSDLKALDDTIIQALTTCEKVRKIINLRKELIEARLETFDSRDTPLSKTEETESNQLEEAVEQLSIWTDWMNQAVECMSGCCSVDTNEIEKL